MGGKYYFLFILLTDFGFYDADAVEFVVEIDNVEGQYTVLIRPDQINKHRIVVKDHKARLGGSSALKGDSSKTFNKVFFVYGDVNTSERAWSRIRSRGY